MIATADCLEDSLHGERYRSGHNGPDSKSIHSRGTPFSEVLAPQGFPDAPGRKWGKVLSKSSLLFPGDDFGVKYTWRCIEVVITALTRNRPGDLEHPLAEILIFQGFPGLEKVRTSCFLSWFSLQFTG